MFNMTKKGKYALLGTLFCLCGGISYEVYRCIIKNY